MREAAVVIPNYNGIQYLETCLDALRAQTFPDFQILLVDNGSTDGSLELVRQRYPEVEVIALPENFGFCRAVNEGIRRAEARYVILLNNDTQVFPDFVEQLCRGMRTRPKAFSGGAMMIQAHDHGKLDAAGDYYSALGWAFAGGKGKDPRKFASPRKVFSVCAGAAVYRADLLREIGLFDEEHFAYLEDLDIGYRARIAGYENWYLPEAKVYHVGSGTSGSRYNLFKIRYSSRNNVYLIWKNMPVLQRILNLPLLLPGFGIKLLFFAVKGYGKEYAAGIKNGLALCRKPENRGKKVKFRFRNLKNYLKIQLELWINLFRRL